VTSPYFALDPDRIRPHGEDGLRHRQHLVSDELYRDIVYDGAEVPPVLPIYEESIIASSRSKSLSLPGERIGYLAVSPRCAEAKELFGGLALSTRGLRLRERLRPDAARGRRAPRREGGRLELRAPETRNPPTSTSSCTSRSTGSSACPAWASAARLVPPFLLRLGSLHRRGPAPLRAGARGLEGRERAGLRERPLGL
jgi:hypothetical protein